MFWSVVYVIFYVMLSFFLGFINSANKKGEDNIIIVLLKYCVCGSTF